MSRRPWALRPQEDPYVIAEIGANHNGDLALARKLIVKAKEAGAQCVKFQSWTKDSVFSRQVYDANCFLQDDYRQREDYNLETIVDKYAISEKGLLEMKEFAKEVNIDFTSTPFSKQEVDFLVDVLDAPFIKVASMDLNNYPFLNYIASKGKPVVLSIGFSNLYEVDKAISVMEARGPIDLCLLHCVSLYPPKDEDVNLARIETLQTAYPHYPVGFSDHTIGTAIPLAAIARGAVIIEKHFTLDKNMEGWDHKVSATPEELATIVGDGKRIVHSIGSPRIRSIESGEKKEAFRRSVVTTRQLSAGDIIRESDLTFKRPGTGIAPEYIDFIVGRKVKQTIKVDTLITKDDLV